MRVYRNVSIASFSPCIRMASPFAKRGRIPGAAREIPRCTQSISSVVWIANFGCRAMINGSTLAGMKRASRWLLASPDKIPHYINGKARRGKLDTLEDLAQFANYEDASAALAKYGSRWNLGFALGPDCEGGYWQGIDFDKIDDNFLAQFVDELPGYLEWSPSRKGVHAIGFGRHFRSLGANSGGIEAYAGGRFFTVTENLIRDAEITCLADHVEHVLAPMHRAASRAAQAALERKLPTVAVSAQAVADLRSALNFLRADDYHLWIEVGHALKTLGTVGRGLWMDWSETSEKFDPLDASHKWDRFLPTHTGYRSVFTKAQAAGWPNVAGNANRLPIAGEINATPFYAPAVNDIPPRPWLLGRWLMRGTVTTVIAPGGTGKSALMVGAALSLSSGRDLLGQTIWGFPKRVWLWNLEDDRDELARQIVACCQYHNLEDFDYAGRLFVNDAGTSLCTATKGRDGLTIHEPVNVALAAEIVSREIDVLVIDPFVSSHRAEENDNGQVDAVAKRWASIAREANCSIVLVHHSRKLGGQIVDAEAARGASALGNAARSVLVLNRMDQKEAARLSIADEERRSYFRVSNDKSNRALADNGGWYRLVSTKLANGGAEGGDSVGVVEHWTPPDISLAFTGAPRAQIQAEIAMGNWRASASAKDWAGIVVANVIGADISVSADKRRAAALLKDMLAQGQLRIEQRKDPSRKWRDFISVGEPAGSDDNSPLW